MCLHSTTAPLRVHSRAEIFREQASAPQIMSIQPLKRGSLGDLVECDLPWIVGSTYRR
jgi:hypothetical protein